MDIISFYLNHFLFFLSLIHSFYILPILANPIQILQFYTQTQSSKDSHVNLRFFQQFITYLPVIPKNHFMKLIIFVSFLLQVIYSIETTILQYLTKTDQQTLIVANQLFNIIESKRYFRQQPFTCLTLLPSNLTKNQVEKVYKLNVTYNYKHLQTQSNQQQATNIPPQPQTQNQLSKEIIGVYEDYDYDKILDLLHGSCAIHETNEFLYEYCHKQKVRQFDNLATFQRMAKQQYEDIAMGYFNYQEALKKSKSDHDKHLRPGNDMFKIKYSQNGDLTIINTLLKNFPEMTNQQREILAKTLQSNMKDMTESNGQPQVTVSTIPSRSVVYDKKNLFTVSDINHKEYDLNKQDKVIHLNYPIIKGNKYFTTIQYTHQVTCQYFSNNTKGVYVAKGVVISFFELAFIGNISKCDKVIDVSYRPIDTKPYESPFYIDKFREYDDFLFGYVDEFCTNNWDWDMSGNNDHKERNNYLEPDNTLWLEMVVNASAKLHYFYHAVTVKKIIAPGVIKVEQNVRQQLMKFKKNTAKSPQDSAWINSCRIISKKPIKEDSATQQNKILRKNLIQIKQQPNTQAKKPGDKILCLCNFKKYNDDFLQMQFTLGNQVFEPTAENSHNSYFEFYEKRTVKTVDPQKISLHSICNLMLCYDMEKQQEKNKGQEETAELTNQLTNKNKFTQIHKFTSKSPILKQNLQTENQIMIIDVSQKGMVKIHTEVEGQKYIYLISTSMLMKIRLFPNGTKQIVRQNSFYENQTTFNYVSWLGNSIFIHRNYIWRGYDKIVFPRMNMGQEKITSIERISGYAYLRKWDLSKMKHKDSLFLSTIKERIEEAFRVKKYPLFAKDQKTIENVGNQVKVQEVKSQNEEAKVNDDNVIEPVPVEKVQEKEDFSSVDFTKSHFKPLNKSVSVRYQYFHGDYCGQPHNRYRRTNVDLQCGQPWLKIQKVKEISPCIYELQVSTRLLCRQEYHKAIEKIQTLKKNTDSRVKLEKGLVCYPEDAWDNALYVYDVQNKEVYLSLG